MKICDNIFLPNFSGNICYSPEVAGSNSIFEDASRSECPIAFNKIGDKCYFYGYFKLNWFRAMEFCHSFGESVSLACIETKAENEDLKNWLIQNGKACQIEANDCSQQRRSKKQLKTV